MTTDMTDPSVPEAIRLWPDVAPGSEGWTHEEDFTVEPPLGRVIHGVVEPTITPVLPDECDGAAVVIAPGGGFVGLAWDHEGLATARWFADRGVAAFVLKYRLLKMDPSELTNAPNMIEEEEAFFSWFREKTAPTVRLAAADGEQAIRTIRERAETWNVDPSRIGIVGYSAGGSVALRTAVTLDEQARPDFIVNVYGAFFDGEVPSKAPPMFSVVAADDRLGRFCIEAAQRWLEAGRPAELHVYETGGHGFALTEQGMPVDGWTDRLAEWLVTKQILSPTLVS